MARAAIDGGALDDMILLSAILNENPKHPRERRRAWSARTPERVL